MGKSPEGVIKRGGQQQGGTAASARLFRRERAVHGAQQRHELAGRVAEGRDAAARVQHRYAAGPKKRACAPSRVILQEPLCGAIPHSTLFPFPWLLHPCCSHCMQGAHWMRYERPFWKGSDANTTRSSWSSMDELVHESWTARQFMCT